MSRRGVQIAGLTFLLCGSALADVTVRQSSATKLPSFIPPEIAKQWQQQSQSGADTAILRIKGDKAHASYGALETLTDYTRNEVTLLDSKTKRYATVPLSELAGRLATAPQHSAIDVQSKRTGQTAVIHGVRTEETRTVVTMQMPFLATGQGANDVASWIRLEVHSWIARPSEIRRVPALGELAEYAGRSPRALDAADFAEKAFSSVPLIGDQLGAALRELSQTAKGLTLKTSIRIYVPAIAQLVQLAPEGAPSDFDPDGPIAESTLDLSDISTEPLPDSDFQVPADFHLAPLDELVRDTFGTTGIPPATR